MSRLLRRSGASNYLDEVHGIQRTVGTLAKLAVEGGGPPFRRDGRIPLYDPDDLDAWAESILTPPAASTAEHDAYQRRRSATRQNLRSAQLEGVAGTGGGSAGAKALRRRSEAEAGAGP